MDDLHEIYPKEGHGVQGGLKKGEDREFGTISVLAKLGLLCAWCSDAQSTLGSTSSILGEGTR